MWSMKQLKSIFVAGLVFDQLSKFFVQRFWEQAIVRNPGLLFGIDLPGFFDFWAVLGLLFVFAKLAPKNLAFGLIVGGAVSNLIDRAVYGYVRDFINLGITTVNLADLAIMIGIGLIALEAMRIPNS